MTDMKNKTVFNVLRLEFQRFLWVGIFFILMTFSSALRAQDNFVGTWQSNSTEFGNESVTMEFVIKDSVNMEMAFITDRRVPNTGRCVSRVSVEGTYRFQGVFFFTKLNNKTLSVNILNLELDKEFEKKVPADKKPMLKDILKTEIKKNASLLFTDYDDASMIYIKHENRDDMITFVLGDEKDHIDLEFTKVK